MNAYDSRFDDDDFVEFILDRLPSRMVDGFFAQYLKQRIISGDVFMLPPPIPFPKNFPPLEPLTSDNLIDMAAELKKKGLKGLTDS